MRSPPALSAPPSKTRSRGSQTTVGTPAATNASRSSSNSLQVGTSRQSTMAMRGGLAVPPVLVAGQERLEQPRDRGVEADVEAIAEPGQRRIVARHRGEELGETLAVARA